jgi:hypothetical protein
MAMTKQMWKRKTDHEKRAVRKTLQFFFKNHVHGFSALTEASSRAKISRHLDARQKIENTLSLYHSQILRSSIVNEVSCIDK